MFESFPPPDFIPTGSAVEGIEVYKPRPAEEEYRPVIEFSCPQCGGQTAYSATDGGLTCTNCGYYEPPQKAIVGKGAAEFEFTVETMERAAHGWGEERKELQCQSCGAYTSVPLDTLTYTCPFCNSSKVIQYQASQDILRPRFLIPFKLEAEACRKIAREWLGSSWMTPKALQQVVSLERFKGVYLPFWTFDATLKARWQAEVGHTKTERYYSGGEWKTRTKIVWKWESGQVRDVVDDLLVRGSTNLSPLLLERVDNYDLRQLAPYEPEYLAGFQAQNYNLPLEKAWEMARNQMRRRVKEICYRQPSTSRIRNFSMELDFADESWRYILLPLYLTAYTYRNKTYQILVNGQTGVISGQRPVDWRKLALVIALIMAPAFIVAGIGLVEEFFIYGVYSGGWYTGAVILFLIGLAIVAKLVVDALRLDDA
jgi:transcription elongation factor Elf1